MKNTWTTLCAAALFACGANQPDPKTVPAASQAEAAHAEVAAANPTAASAPTPPSNPAEPTQAIASRATPTPQPTPAPTPPPEKDQYHVYRFSPGKCEVDMRNHKRFADDRGSGSNCMGHFDHRMDADKLREKLIKEQACKK